MNLYMKENNCQNALIYNQNQTKNQEQKINWKNLMKIIMKSEKEYNYKNNKYKNQNK